MSADSIKAGGAVVTVGGDTNPLSKAIEEAKSKIQKFGESMQNMGQNIGIAAGIIGGIGAAITAPFAAGLAMLVESARPIAATARAVGMSFEEVQDVAAGFRISVEDLPAVIAKMSSAIVDARNPTSQMARDFAELGLNINELNGAGPAQQLMMVSDALSRVTDNARRIDLQRALLGRGGLSVNVSGGAEAIQGRIDRNRELGGVISNEDGSAGLAYAKAQSELKVATTGLSIVLGAILAPIMRDIVVYILDVVMSVRGWIDANRPLLDVLAKVGVAFGVIGTVLALDAARIILIGKAFAWLPTVVGYFTGLWTTLKSFSILGTIASVGATIGAVFAKIGAVVAAVFASAAFWPVVLILGAIVAVAYAVYSAFDSWAPAIAIVKAGFILLWQGIKVVWDVVSGFVVSAVSAIMRVVVAVLKVVAAIWAITSAIIVLPILAAAMAAVAAVGYVVYQVFRGVVAVLGYLWGMVVRVYNAIAEFVSGIIDSIDWVSVLTATLISLAPMFAVMFGPAIIGIGLMIGAYKLLMLAIEELAAISSKVWQAIVYDAKRVASFMSEIWEDVVAGIQILWGDMVAGMQIIWDRMIAGMEIVFSYFDSASDGMLAATVGAFNMIGDFICEELAAAAGFVMSVFSLIGDFIGGVFWSIIDVVMAVFNELRAIVSGGVDTVSAIVGDMGIAFGAIGDFISAGDWAAAFDVAMLALRLAWERTKNWLTDSWYRVTFIFGSVWDALVQSLAPVLAPVVKSIIGIFFSLVEGIQTVLNTVIDKINIAIRAIPPRFRPELLGQVNLVGANDRQNAMNAIDDAFAPGAPREQAFANRDAQNALAAELEQARIEAELARWQATEDLGDGADGAAGRHAATRPAAALTFGGGMGSFSASHLGQIGASNYAERTATAVEALIAPARRTADALENNDGGVVAS